MKRNQLHRLVWLLAASVLASACLPGTHAPEKHSTGLGAYQPTGFWQDVDEPGYFAGFEDGRLSVGFQGQIREVGKILTQRAMTLHLCEQGRDVQIEVSFEGSDLVLYDSGKRERRRFRRLPERPPELALSPLPLPPARPLAPDRVEEIQGNLWERLRDDQLSLREVFPRPAGVAEELVHDSSVTPSTPDFIAELKLVDVTTSNTCYLKELVSQVGWIDAERFGYAASNSAFLLVQHSNDLPLMLAALPKIKEDVDQGRFDGEAYALLYDRLQLSLGEKQRYGSQIGHDENGDPFVLPVEEPARVDEMRAALGMPPLKQYLAVFGASEVRFSSACSEGPPSPEQ